MIKWDESYSVSIKSFDEHHRKLFDIFNTLLELSQDDEKEMQKNVAELLDYTNYHFGEEEKQLTEHGYPELDKHKSEHEDFISSVNVFKASFDYGVVPPTDDLLEFLKNWLSDHIKKTDKNYSDFLNEKGAS